MRITDILYGEYKINGILEELVLSKPVQRLKGVYLGGASYLVNRKWNVTRYEHSIGVMLLIKKMGGSLEEQIAGLLHDISHTAFSHVIDFVFDNRNEDYHEGIYQDVIMKSDIPHILSRYGLDCGKILSDHAKWELLEQPAPDLCADRIDYTLRDMYQHGNITLEEITAFLDNLSTRSGKLLLTDIHASEWFVETYYKEVIDFFLNPLNIYGYDYLAKALRIALDKQIISIDTLFGTDEEVLFILKQSDDVEITSYISKVHRDVIVEENKTNYDIHRKNKVRLVDPTVLYNNQVIRSSQLSDTINTINKKAKRKAEEGIYVKILSN